MQHNISTILKNLGIVALNPAYSTGTKWGSLADSARIDSFSPVDGKKIASVQVATTSDYEAVVKKAEEAYLFWRSQPAPTRLPWLA